MLIKFRICLVFSGGLILIGCGSDPTPIAFKKITPELENDGGALQKSLAETANDNPVNLLQAAMKQGVPEIVVNQGFAKFDQYRAGVRNPAYLTIIDYTQSSAQPRFYMINTTTGKVDALLVAHGVGSDPGNTGTPTRFSNLPNSKMTSLGAYMVNERYLSHNHGITLRLDGLEATNNLARPREILLHSAVYVDAKRPKLGMSWGCPAVALSWINTVIQRLADGSFLFAFGPAPPPSALDDARAIHLMTDPFLPSYMWLNEGDGAPVNGEN